MAGVVPKANAVHAKLALDKHLLNREHRLLCSQPSPWATTCHRQHLTLGHVLLLCGRLGHGERTGPGNSKVMGCQRCSLYTKLPEKQRDSSQQGETQKAIQLQGMVAHPVWPIYTGFMALNPDISYSVQPW